jgi:hypothetical protein
MIFENLNLKKMGSLAEQLLRKQNKTKNKRELQTKSKTKQKFNM